MSSWREFEIRCDNFVAFALAYDTPEGLAGVTLHSGTDVERDAIDDRAGGSRAVNWIA